MNFSGLRRLLPGLLAFLWLAGIVTLYYVSHKPFSPALALSLAGAGWQIVVALAIVSVGGGLGARLLKLEDMAPCARLSVQAALGLGLIGTGLLCVGATLGYPAWIGWGLLAALGLGVRKEIVLWWRDWRKLSELWSAGGRLGRTIAAGSALVLLFTLTTSLAPPLKFDALVYHLTLPQIYISAGKFTYVNQLMFWGMPQLQEMLYTWGMTLGSLQAATVLGWAIGVLALVGLAGYVSERLDARAGWVSVASLLCGFTIANSLAWGYADWMVALQGLAFLIMLDLWRTEGQDKTLWVMAIFAGLALSTKYTAGVLLICGVVGMLWAYLRKELPVRLLPSLFGFALISVAVFSPWLIKNFVATGNPVYPLFITGGAMDRLRLHLIQTMSPWGNGWDLFLLPLRATYFGFEAAPGYSAAIGPLLLGLGLPAFLNWPASSRIFRATVINAALIALPVILVWAVSGRLTGYLLQTRLYIAGFPAMAVLAGAGFTKLAQVSWPGVRLGRVVGILIVLIFGFSVLDLGVFTLRQGAPQVVFALQSPEKYLDDNLGWFAPTMRAIQELAPTSKVIMLWETRSLYCLPKCIPDEILDRWLRELNGRDGSENTSTQNILKGWREAGYTHLLYYQLGANFERDFSEGRYQPSDWQALDNLLALLPKPENFGDTYLLYSLAP